jgi:hypothetical protein
MPPAESPDTAPLQGEVVFFYAFDVANEIRLNRAAELLAGQSVPFVTRRDRPAPRDLPVSKPLSIEVPLDVRYQDTPVGILIRIYEVGVISILLRIGFRCNSLAELGLFHAPRLTDGRLLDQLARDECHRLYQQLQDALIAAGPPTEPEAYTVFCFTQIGAERDVNRWLGQHEREVAGLLTQTPAERLSTAQVTEVLRLRRSFENTDLVVIDWDAALLIDLGGSAHDVLFVLESANLQLEEFRWMDRTLDHYLERAYDDVGRHRWWFGAATGILGTLRRLRVDFARLADEVIHITKFVGDWHLARVYMMARERFHLDQWRASVDLRLAELDRLYTMAQGDLYDRRMLWLEAIIVLFFAVDLIILFFK